EEEAAAHQPLDSPARIVNEAGEGREVQRSLLDAALAELLQAARDEELGQAVRRLVVAAHQRERDGRPPVARREVEEPADPAVGAAADDDEAVAVVVAPQRVERHGEAALVRVATPAPAHLVELREIALRELAKLMEARAVAL